MLEAGRNDDIHAVPVKTTEHQAIASLHRLRATWLATRTARLNTVRGLLREFGLVIPVGATHVVPRVREWLSDSTIVPDLMRTSLASACDEMETIETNMRAVPGVGLVTATALVPLVGDIQRFPSGRQCASSLGLTPKEDSPALTAASITEYRSGSPGIPQATGSRRSTALARTRTPSWIAPYPASGFP